MQHTVRLTCDGSRDNACPSQGKKFFIKGVTLFNVMDPDGAQGLCGSLDYVMSCSCCKGMLAAICHAHLVFWCTSVMFEFVAHSMLLNLHFDCTG